MSRRISVLLSTLLIFTTLFIGCDNPDVITTVSSGEGSYNGRVIGTVHGIITTQDNNTPFEKVTVIYAIAGANYIQESDRFGYYRCDGLTESTYSFTFLSPDTIYADMFKVVEVAYDSAYMHPSDVDYRIVISRNVVMLRKNAGITGYVFARTDDETTAPAAGVRVRATGFDGILNANFSAVTDTSGYYSFEDLPAVDTVTVITMPWSNGLTSFQSSQTEVNIIPDAVVNADNIIISPSATDIIVLSNNFANGDFPVNGSLVLEFSRPISEAGLGVELTREEVDVPRLFSLDVSGLILTVEPTVILRAGTAYSLFIQGRGEDYARFTFGPVEFTTEAGIDLESTSLYAADGIIRDDVGLDETINFRFTREIDTVNADNRVVLQRQNVDVLVNWSFSEDGRTLLVTPEGTFRPGAEYSLGYRIFSTLPEDFITTLNNPFIFQTIVSGGPPAQVAGLEVSPLSESIDWNTTNLNLQWLAITGVDYYDVYGYDSHTVNDHVFLGRIVADRLFGMQRGIVGLPLEFDWIQGDDFQTPFTHNIQVKLLVRAVNDFGAGEFSEDLTLRDNTAPAYEIRQDRSADNSAGVTDLLVTFRFDDPMEYCDSRHPPDWGFIEFGGDLDYVLPEDAAVWRWDEDLRNGDLRVTIPAAEDGSGDKLWLLGITDTSGNTQVDTVWVDIH